jgi:hypothetical protein
VPRGAIRAPPFLVVRRAVAIVLGFCLGLLLIYWVGMNVFLGTRLLRSVANASPDQLQIEYSSAYTIIPGRAHVKGLSIRGSDDSVEWILRIDDCDFRIHPLDLLHKKFHVGHVRASGVSMRIRLRLKQEEATPEVVSALPPVPGFTDPPYLLIGPPTPPVTDEEYNLWAIQLDDVDAQRVDEIWAETIRFFGDLRVRGSWLFRPARLMAVAPAAVDVHALDVSYGDAKPFLSALHGTMEPTMHAFDPRKAKGRDILEYVSLNTFLSGVADPQDLLNMLIHKPPLRLDKIEEGPVAIRLVVSHGHLRPGTVVSTSATSSAVSLGDLSLSAISAGEFRVDADERGPEARTNVGLTNLRVFDRETELGQASRASVHLAARDLDLAHSFMTTATFALTLDSVRSDSLSTFRRFLPPKVALDSKAVRADGHFEGLLSEATAEGELGFSVEALSFASGTYRGTGNLVGSVKLEHGSAHEHDIDLSGSHLSIENASGSVGALAVTAPRIDGRAARARLARGQEPEIDVEVDLPRIDAPHLRGLSLLLPPGAPRVDDGRARGSGHAVVSVGRRTVTGSASLLAEGLSVRTGKITTSGRVGARVDRAEVSWGRPSVDVRGAAIDLRDLSASSNRTTGVAVIPLVSARAGHIEFVNGRRSGTISVEVPAAEVPDLHALSDELGMPAVLSLTRGSAAASVKLEADVRSGSFLGNARVATSDLRVKVGKDDYDGELSVTLHASSVADHPELTELSGSTVAFSSNDAPPQAHGKDGHPGWWARVALRDADLRLLGGPRFRAVLEANAESASPVKALVAKETPVPRWVLDVFAMKDLRAEGEILASPSSIEARSVAAVTSGPSARFEYAKQQENNEGIGLVSSGSLRLGFRFGTPGTKLLLFGAEKWFTQQVEALRARTAEVSEM